MTVDIFATIETLLIGLVTGVLSGAFGVGGGIFCTPVVRLLLNVSPHVAVGTTMALIIPTSIVGAINYVKQKQVDMRLAKLLAPPAVLGTVIGATATHYVQPVVLMILFAVFAGIAGLDLALGIGEGLTKKKKELGDQAEYQVAPVVPAHVAIGIGFWAGFLAGFFGVGGGFILVPCLLYTFHISVKAAFGTSLLVIAAVSIPGTLAHATQGHMDFHLALTMIAGAVPGAWLGSLLSLRLKDSFLRRAFGVVMLLMSVMLAAKELGII
ncbi:sulfite exporter TauE/SafE family protein [soil metagenome]